MSTAEALVIVVPFVLASLAVVWFFWRGNNWARVLTIVYSLLAISGLAYVPVASPAQQALTICDAAFSAALIYWLFRPSVRGYFKPVRARRPTIGSS